MKQTLTLLILVVLAACTTIEIEERSIFDAHQTITPETFDYNGLNLHQHTLETEDGEQLDSWYIEREDAVATVLYLGGNGFLMVKSRPWLDIYAGLPVNIVMIDSRGYGQSSGAPSVEGVKYDAKEAYNFAAKHSEETGTKLLIHGHSMGSLLAGYMADTHEAAGYILESPITNADDLTSNILPRLLRPFIGFEFPEVVKEEDNLKRVAGIEIPLLLIGGEDDEVTPFSMAEKLYEKSVSSPKKLVKVNGGGHNDLPNKQDYRDALEAFLGDVANLSH